MQNLLRLLSVRRCPRPGTDETLPGLRLTRCRAARAETDALPGLRTAFSRTGTDCGPGLVCRRTEADRSLTHRRGNVRRKQVRQDSVQEGRIQTCMNGKQSRTAWL